MLVGALEDRATTRWRRPTTRGPSWSLSKNAGCCPCSVLAMTAVERQRCSGDQSTRRQLRPQPGTGRADAERRVAIPCLPPASVTAIASRVLPTPPGPARVTNPGLAERGHDQVELASASDETGPGAGEGRGKPAECSPVARPRTCAAARRRGIPPFVRTRAVGGRSVFVRCSPTAASTSASRWETPSGLVPVTSSISRLA